MILMPKTTIIAGGFAVLLLAGCQRDEVQVYRVAKDETPAPMTASAPSAPLPPGHPDVSGAPAAPAPALDKAVSPVTWKTPDGWKEVPPTEMRLASFKIEKNGQSADVSVIPLPGLAGNDAANVNRWRGQVGLGAVTADELQKSAENIEAGGQPGQLYDLVGTNPGSGDKTRILGVIQHRDGTAWFFKMTGDADLAEQQKPAFIEFLKSLKFVTAASQVPPGHPDISSAQMPATPVPSGPISHEGQPNWQVPAGWQEVPGGQFLVAKFLLPGDAGAQAAVNVSASVGDGGGLQANVNRWRGQLGLQPIAEILTTDVPLANGKGTRIDMEGTNPQTGKPAKLIGIMVPQGDRTYFYKLMGDAAVVDAQKDAFVKFVQNVKY